MADNKGSDPKPSDTKSGPVKPPVLDLKAREAGADTPQGKPEVKPTAAKEPPASPKPPVPPHPEGKPPTGRFAFGAALAGGALGVAAAYGLAWYGLWPTPPVPAAPADPRLAQFGAAIPELETVTQTTQAELAALNQRIVALESAEPASATASESATAAPVDLSGIESDIASLTSRLDQLADTPPPATDTAALDTLRADLSAIGTRIDELAARLGTAEAELRTLDTTVTETTATLADQPSDIGAVLQLPLILSGFETAFATGRPYATELGALRAAVPDAEVPTAIANKAETGLTRPDVIASRFAAVLPAMLAGRPANPDASWQDSAMDWFRSAIALRPTGEIEGDTPEAVITRLEAAIDRRDFAAAQTLLSELPQSMLEAAGDVPALVAEQAEAPRFLDALRTSALSGEVTQ